MDDLVHYDHTPIPNKYRLRDHPGLLQFYRKCDEEGVFGLSEVEQHWREDYDYLLSRGYQLRPRFHPGWSPSWRGTDVSPLACEDSIEHFKASVIDAKRLSDGKIVAIKRVPSLSSEDEIAHMLSSSERRQHPMNCCVPIFDHFPDSRGISGTSFIVMPLLRAFNDPPFSYVDEVVDFVRQTLKGLVYLHSQNVVHRDLSDGNIMMDGGILFGPDGFHPSDQCVTARDIRVFAKPRARRDVEFVKYYIIDFELSKHFSDPSRPRLVTGSRAQEHATPELNDAIPYNPFPVDVFTLGMVFKRNFLDEYSNVEFLSPLCAAMTERLPWKRPSAREALAIFQQLSSNCSGLAGRWRLRRSRESRFQRIVGDAHSGLREVSYQIDFIITSCVSMLRAALLHLSKVSLLLLYSDPRRLIRRVWRPFKEPEAPESQPLLA